MMRPARRCNLSKASSIGSSVYIYTKNGFKFLHRLQCLNGQKIHGLVPNEVRDYVLVFGGKQFSVLSLECPKSDEDDLRVARIVEPVVSIDWLHSAAWMKDDTMAVLTAHNIVQVWDLSNNSMISQHLSKENSILYSGLLLALQDGVLVFAGTVFSEVIVSSTTDENPLHYLKGHRGVIFSITVDLKRGIIITTSDDRSVRIWGVDPTYTLNNTAIDTTEYWQNCTIICKHEVYGHTARVMRSCITDDSIISVGEDSTMCYWDLKGKLLKKYITHQNGCIWCVDANKTHAVTGGGDCAVILHPMTAASYNGQNKVINFNVTPRKIAFTARKNLIILDDNDNLVYFNVSDTTQTEYKLFHDSTYKLFTVSDCKQLIAVGEMNGKLDIFAENCKDVACLTNIIDTRVNLGKVLSMHWAGNRHLVFCAEHGVITVISSRNNDIETFAVFMLPPCKERWLTSAAMDHSNKFIVVGDRCGNIHVYLQGNKNPYKTFNRVHGRYGPTSITIKNNEFVTTGRDRCIKYFSLDKNDKSSTKYMCSKELEFQWVEKFIDKDDNIVCGFQERTFVVYNVKNHNKILEVICGGGHRSWDVFRYVDKAGDDYDEYIKLVYIKNSDVHSHIFQMSKIISQNVVNSSHSKEINCLKTFNNDLDPLVKFYVTGGEDTTLRISTIDAKLKFQDEVVFKQLSNVRTLTLVPYPNSVLVISAGGRAQICLKIITILSKGDHLKVASEELIDYMIKGTDRERKNNQTWRNSTIDFDPETRVMDLDAIKLGDGRIIVYAGCSDAYLRIFSFFNKAFTPIGELKHHNTCILKTVCVRISMKDILITCTTTGEVTLWDVSNPLDKEIVPFFTTKTNKSGINSVDTRVLSDKELLIATGGDENAVILSLFEVLSSNDASIKQTWCTDKYHCSQITGVKFVEEFLLTTSIDQRVTLAKWTVDDESVSCEFLTQIFSDVADVQGLDVLNSSGDSITVCVYGKGLEVLRVPIPGPRKT
ncbi:hypothetical protein evm_011686 [Chilo suppressalis]|nr:hypothetical protein evm_011686 [Chilo suppressalis]